MEEDNPVTALASITAPKVPTLTLKIQLLVAVTPEAEAATAAPPQEGAEINSIPFVI
jgi:hypothetical protein